MNRFILHEDYAEMVLLDKNKIEKARTYIDIEDIEKVDNYHWCVFDDYVYTRVGRKQKKLYLHRFVTDCPQEKVVDHINHNTLDNRKENLRICTKQQNNMNRKCKGISQLKNGKWRAYIVLNYKQMHLGRYETEEEAIEARRQAEEKYFKEYKYMEGENK